MLFFVFVGYKITEVFDYVDLLFAIQTLVLSLVVKIVLFLSIATVMKRCSRRNFSYKLVLLLAFGSLKSPRCILLMSEFAHMPYTKLFNNSLIYLIVMTTIVGGLSSKWIVRAMDEEEEVKRVISRELEDSELSTL